MIPMARPLLGVEEKQAVLRVLDSGFLAQGPTVAAFEEAFAAYCGTKYAIAVNNGTTALQAMLQAAGIGPGDEIITSPFTFIASSNSIIHAGAKPVFADIDPVSYCLNPSQVEQKITSRTKAILPVHLFGHPADMTALRHIAVAHNLLLFEDAAQAHGATLLGKKVGSLGHACAFSLYATKNMMCGEGGVITTSSDAVNLAARSLRAHGASQKRYYHDSPGYNFKMTEIAAAISLCQLRKLDLFNLQRQQNAEFLCYSLADLDWLTLPSIRPDFGHVFHQFTVRVPANRRDAFIVHLKEQGVDSGIFYPVPIHKQKYYQDMGYTDSLPVAERIASEVVSLPVHPGLRQEELETLVLAVRSFKA